MYRWADHCNNTVGSNPNIKAVNSFREMATTATGHL